MASREELLRIAEEGVRKSGGVKGTGGRTLDITKILPSIGADDWGVEGLGRNRALGGGGIPSSAGTRRYIYDQRQAQLPVPQYPGYYKALQGVWGAAPDPVKNYLKKTGSAMLSGLYTLAIPISVSAGIIGDGIIAANDWAWRTLGRGIGEASGPAESAARLREDGWGPNGDANIIQRLGNEMKRVWDKRNRGAHEHYYGYGDTFAAIGLWQDKEVSELEWWFNRGLAVSLDLVTDPLNALTVAGKVPKAIHHGMQSGWGNKLFNSLMRERLVTENMALLNRLGDDGVRMVTDAFTQPQFLKYLADDIVNGGSKVVTREGDDIVIDLGKHLGMETSMAPTGTVRDLATGAFVAGGPAGTLGRVPVKLKIPKSLLDDLPDLVNMGRDAMVGSLGKLSPSQYRRIGDAMLEVGMDLKFRTLGEEGFTKVISKADIDGAMNFAYKLPGTGFIGRKFTNPVLRTLGIDELTGPIPMKLFSLENRFLGLPTRAAMRGFHKFFLGRGNRWTGGGRMKDIKKLIRNPNTNPLLVHEYKGSVSAAGRGAQMGRRAFQEMDRLWKEFKTNAQAHPQLTGEKGGAIIGRAMGGDPAALAQLRKIDPALEAGVESLMPLINDIANRRAGMKWLNKVANYRPRPLSKAAADRMAKRGLGPTRRSGRPYQPAGFEKGRNYIDVEEFTTLVDNKIAEDFAKGIMTSRDEAIDAVAMSGKMDSIFGHKLYKPGTIKPDGSAAKDVETQIADIMGEMGITHSLFEENAYKFVPEYIRGVAARTGEVFTEQLLLDQGIFIDRMVRLKAVPHLKVQQAWTKVMRAQAALKRSGGALDGTLNEHATALGAEKEMLAKQIAEQEHVARLAKTRYRSLVDDFDATTKEALAAEARAQEQTDKLIRLKDEYLEATAGMSLDDAVKQQILKNDLDQKIIGVFGEENYLKHQLTTLRGATYSRLFFEDALISRYGSIEVFNDLKKFMSGFDDLKQQGFWDGDPEVILNWVTGNQARLREQGIDSFEMVGDGLFRVKLGGVMHDQDQFYGLLRAGDEMLESMDVSPIGQWMVVDQQAMGLAWSDDFFQLKRLEQMRRKLVEETEKPSALLSQYLEAGGKATWAGEVPTPEAVMSARQTIKEHFEGAVQGVDKRWTRTIDQNFFDLAVPPEVESALHTYYQVFGDDILRATSMRNMDDIDSFVQQIEVALRERSAEIEEALAGFNTVTFDVAEQGGTVIRYSLPEYARLKAFQIGKVEVMATRGMPFKNMDTPVDNILAGKLVARNNSGEAGVIGGSNEGGRYRVRTNRGVKDYYVKKLGMNPDTDPTWAATAGDIGQRRAFSEVLANAMYRELGFGSPTSYASQASDGSWYVVAPWLDDLQQVGVNPAGGFRPRAEAMGAHVDLTNGVPRLVYDVDVDTPVYEILGEGFLADAFLANWDTAGLDIENIAFDQAGRLIRIDNGGTFNFRAQGLPKTAGGAPFDWKKPGASIRGLLNDGISPTYAPMAKAWRDSQPDMVQSLIGQYRQLDQVRMEYGGWNNFVRRHLPDGTSDDVMAEFVEFLEVRHQQLAKGLAQDYVEGAALAKARIHQQGASPQVADEIIGGTYGPLQGMSESYGYPAWLSPEHDGISESQAIDFFSVSEALGHVAEGRKLGNAAEAAIQRDEELLRQVEEFIQNNWDEFLDPAPGAGFLDDTADGFYPVEGPTAKTMDDPFANPWVTDGPSDFLGNQWGANPLNDDARFGMIVLNGDGQPLMRMPTAADGTAGDPFGGVLWTFPKGGMNPGETPYETAVRETLEETGMVVEGFATLPEGLPGSSGSMNYYYIGRIKPGTTKPSVIAERQLVDQQAADGMAQFLHVDRRSSAQAHSMDASGGAIIGDQSWFDAWSTNFSGITDNYINDANKIHYPIQANLGTAGDQIIVYGVPAEAHEKVAAFVMSQRLADDVGLVGKQARADIIKDKASDLDSFLGSFTPSGRPYEFTAQVAGRDQAMDFMTRLYEYDPNLYDHFVHLWRQSGDGQYQGAAEVLDFVDNFRHWGIPTITDMNLRNRIGFLDFLDSRGVIDKTLADIKGVHKGKVWSSTQVDPPYRPTFKQELTEIELEKYAAEYLASFDEGLTRVLQWQAFVAGPGGGGRWGQRVAKAQTENRAWAHAKFFDGIETAERQAIGKDLFLLERVHLGKHIEKPLGSVEQAGVPVARNLDDIVDLIDQGWSANPANAGKRFDRKLVRSQLEAFLEDRRVTIKAFDVYKRSLTADGFNMGMWYNTFDDYAHSHRGGDGFTNAFMVNPHAIKAMPRASVSGKIRSGGSTVADHKIAPDGGGFVRTGEGVAPGGVLDAQKFMDEYERAVMEGGIGGDLLPKGDPIREALDAKIEMAIEGEQFFAQRAATLRNKVEQLTAAKEAGKKDPGSLVEDVGKLMSKQERAQLNTLMKSVDKRMQLIDTAEATLARLGTVDEYGRAIPMENLPDEVRNLRFAVDALEDADARGFSEAISELEGGADAAKWLRQVGEYGDDTIYFPVNKEFIQERYLDEGFQQGFSAFGVKSQGPSEIVESMVTVDRFYAEGGFATFLKHYDKVYNLLKGYMIMKPGFHMRNYFSAIFMNYLDGVKMGSYRRFQNAYWTNEYDKAVAMNLPKRAENMKKAMKLRGVRGVSAEDMDIIRRLDAEGLLGGAQGQIGTEQVMGEDRVGGTLAKALQAVNPLSSRNAPLRLSRSAGVGTETYVRGVMAFDSLARGDLASEAFERVMKFHFDYSDLSRFEASGVKRVVPFYTWTRKNLPLMIEQVGKRPGVFNQYNILKANIENMSQGQEGWDDPLPAWMIRQAGIRLPFKYDGEFMHVLPDLPFKTPLEMLGPLTEPGDTPAERIQAALGVLTTQLTPFVKTPIEWTTRRNMWKGYNFDGRMGQVPTVYAKVPLLMPLLQKMDMAHKNEAGIWLMRDYDLHSMASLLPTFSDARRLFPSEERYQQRILSTWMSFVFGLGLRTNTKAEQQRTRQSVGYELRAERSEQQRRQRVGLSP